MHVPAVTDNYIGAKMLIQLHLMSLWTFNWPIHHFWSFGLDCSILPAAPNVTMDMKLAYTPFTGHLAWTAVYYLQHLLTVHTMYSTIVQCHCST